MMMMIMIKIGSYKVESKRVYFQIIKSIVWKFCSRRKLHVITYSLEEILKPRMFYCMFSKFKLYTYILNFARNVSIAFLKAIEAAILNDISEESTTW